MLMLLSPAKLMNFDPAPQPVEASRPRLKSELEDIAAAAKTLSRGELKSMMGLSDDLAELNHERFQAFKASGRIRGAKPAALTFAGDVYRGLDAETLNPDDLDFAQDHLRILSGLYGLLRPLDAIQPYRLEMGSALKNARGKSLYDFWRPVLAERLKKDLKGHADKTIVNLASNEYAKAVDRDALGARFVTLNFKEVKDGKARAMMVFVKQARGIMARWAIRERIVDSARLKEFRDGGYRFDEDASSDDEWIFTRPQPPKKS